MAAVTNASPLVLLGKLKKLGLLKELFGLIYMPPAVKVEVVDRGRESGAPDVFEVEKGLSEGWLKAVKLSSKQMQKVDRLMRETGLGFGEAQSLVVAKDRELTIILDDREARAVAEAWDLELSGTIAVLYEAFVKSLLDYDELVASLTELSKLMWVSTDVIAAVMKKAREVKK